MAAIQQVPNFKQPIAAPRHHEGCMPSSSELHLHDVHNSQEHPWPDTYLLRPPRSRIPSWSCSWVPAANLTCTEVCTGLTCADTGLLVQATKPILAASLMSGQIRIRNTSPLCCMHEQGCMSLATEMRTATSEPAHQDAWG